MYIIVYQFYGENACVNFSATEAGARIIQSRYKSIGASYADIYLVDKRLED